MGRQLDEEKVVHALRAPLGQYESNWLNYEVTIAMQRRGDARAFGGDPVGAGA